MSDQNFFHKSINPDGNAAETFTIPNSIQNNPISSGVTVVNVDTTLGEVTVDLPDALASAGMRITVVNQTGTNAVRIGPSGTDLIDGIAASVAVAAVAYASTVVVSMGAAGWATP